MGLKAVVEKIEDIDEGLRSHYVERNGKFELSVELSGIDGIKSFTDFSKLNEALRKERNDHKGVRDRLGLLGERKVEDVLKELDRIPELEALANGKVDEEKIEQIVEGRIRAKTGPIERERDQLKAGILERDKKLEEYVVRERTRTIHDAVREAVGKSQGFQTSAVEDALVFAERMLEVDESGRVVTRDNVGVTPGIEAAVWLTEMQAKKSHWWGPTQGGGSGGNRGGVGGGSNPWSHEGWNMTEQGKILVDNRSRAEQMAKAAGTFIGGPRPVKK